MTHLRIFVMIFGVLAASLWWGTAATGAAHLVDFVDIGVHSIVPPGEKLWIGVTLQPYYSYVKNIVGDVARVFPIAGPDFDPHNPKSEPDIIKNIQSMHIVVINAIGHDEYAIEIIQYGALKDVPIYVIPINKDVSLIPGTDQDLDGNLVNSHTFLSVTATLRQIRNLQDALVRTDPAHAMTFRRNAREYALKLRQMKAEYIQRLADLPNLNVRCAATSEAYAYLLQEFGLETELVLEQGHGQVLQKTDISRAISIIQERQIEILFADHYFPEHYAEQIQEATSVNIYYFSHILDGDYTTEKYEEEMRHNLEMLTNALQEAQHQH